MTNQKDRLRRWLTVGLGSLLIHYLMILLAQFLLSGSMQGLGKLITDRLTMPGDAERYLDIAKNGYTATGENAINLVFYPLYPMMIRIFSCLGGNMAVIGMIISQISLAGASILFYELILLDGEKYAAFSGVLLLNLYPFSMFAMGVFTEGLFLLLTIGCMYAIRRHKFFLAGIVGFFAALTRVQGMLLLIPAACEWIIACFGKKERKMRIADAGMLLIPGGFGIYLGINYALHGNAVKFLEFEAGDPWYQTTEWIGRNITQQYQMAVEHTGLSLTIYWVQIALYFIFLGVLILGFFRRERISYLLYGGAYLGFTYLSGWMISGGRYLLCCFPVIIIFARMKDGISKRLLFMGAGMLFFAYSLFYLMGFAIM